MTKIVYYILLIFSLVMSNNALSSHAAAVDLTYTCLGGNQYAFTLSLYRDCAGSGLGGNVNINLESILCGQNFNANLTRTSVTEVSQVCGAQIANTTCNGGGLPGIEEHIYTGTVTLPANCADWRVSYTLCCRNNAITNINNGNLYTDVRIDNTGGNCNNSPTFNSGIPILYTCVGDPVNFNNAAIDVDGDSLTYTLVNPWGANNTNLNYTDPSFNPTNPMFTSGGFIFDSLTGQITFTSPGLQQAVVSVLINEYDSLGNWKGSIRRDIQFIVINCPPPVFVPVVTGVNYDSVNFTFNACYTDAFCFDMYGTSGDPSVPMVITYDNGIPGGTFTTTQSGDTTFGTFCWSPGLSVGSYRFTLRGEADVCPVQRVSVFSYTVNIDTTFTNCNDSIIYLDAFGNATVDSTYVVVNPNNSCVTQSVVLDQTNFDCSEVGVNNINVTTTFSNGLIKNCVSQITVIDTLPPNAVCKDTTIYLDASGTYTIDTSYIDNGSMDNCAIQSMSLSNYTFSCADVGVNAVTLYVTDIYGNIDSCTANVTVQDTIPPTPICKDTTIYLNLGGNFTIDSSFIENGSTDICGIETITLSNYNYNCVNTGINSVTMYVTDINGNIDSCTANVNVIDTVPPTPVCKDTTIYLNTAGNFTIDSSFINNGSSDNCAISSITLSNYNYTCANVGVNPVTMYVIDVNGNIDSCTANVFVQDTIPPTPVCKDTTIYLNTAGNFTIDSSYINNGSSDNCAISTITLSSYTFTCADVGVNSVTMYVTDINNNIDSCSANIVVQDTTPPTAICQDTTIYLDAVGNFNIDSSYINNGSSDNCAISSITLSNYNYTCANIGVNLVTMYVTDVNGNIDSCTANVIVQDTIPPTPICQDTTIYLDVTGNYSIDSSYIDNASSDNCAISSITLSNYNYTCANIGFNPVTMYVTDVNGNIDSCVANVIVQDTTLPTPICQDTTIYLDVTGNFVIDSSFIDNSSYDNCAVATITLSRYTFNCADTGTSPITMYVTDVNGNLDSCVANITVIDTVGPVALCKDTTIYLDASGVYTIDSSYIDNGSSDACGIVTLSQSLFTCTDVGPNNVTLYVTDANLNQDSCTAVVTVIDSVRPVVACKDTTIYLNASGSFTIDSSFIENGSTDACGIQSITLSQYTFTCANVGNNPTTMYVTDVNGNIDSCVANVIVQDTTLPTPICQDTTIYLDVTGNFVIDSSFIDNSSYDNCAIATITLSRYTFNCADTGTSSITMYVTDVNGNLDSCLANITVIDTVGPVALCKDTTIYLDASGVYTIDSSYIDNGSSDACGILTVSQSLFNCSNVGPNNVTLYVTDANLNQDSCTAVVTVLDTINPVVVCKDTTIYLNASGSFTIDSSFIENGSTDACGIQTISLSQYNFTCTNIGNNSTTMYVTDVNGNIDSCIANVIVQDTTIPTPICKDTTLYLDNSGNFVIDSSFIDNGSFDNCGVATITLSRYFFTCADTGINTLTMYVTDFVGNIDSCTANVTIFDTVIPVAICKDTSIYLNASGVYTIDSSYIDNGSADACGIITLSQSLFTCADVGSNNVTLYVTDANLNLDSCTSTVTVIDTISPIAICRDTLIYLDASGQFTIDSSFINNGSSDACGIQSITLNQYTFTCADTGVNTILLTVTDVNGNVSTCNAIVTVRDSIIPFVDAGQDDSLCAQYNYVLNGNTPTGTLVGTWRIINSPNLPLFSDFHQANATVTNLIEGRYTFSWTITNGLGCNVVADTVDIYVYDQPISNAGPDTSLCNTYSMNMRANVPAGLSTGEWTFLTPAPSTPIFSDSTDPYANISGLIEGNYTFIWTVSNGNCTPVTSAVTISVYDPPFANAGNDQDLCNTYNTILLGNTPAGTSTGLWNVISGPNVPTITTPTNAVTGMNGMIEGTYTVTWTVSNGTCAPVTDTMLVNVYDQPVSNAGPDTNLCAIYNLNLYGNMPVGTAYGEWYINPNHTPPSTPIFADSSQYNTNISGLVEGTYELLWIVRNGNCVAAIDSISIHVWDRPLVSAGIDTSLCSTYDIELYATPIFGLSKGQWSLDPSFSNPNVPNIANSTQSNAIVTGLIEGTYRFIWNVTNGPCFDISDTLIVDVFDQPTAIVGPDQDLCFQTSTTINAVPLNGSATGTWNLANGTPNTPTFNPNTSSTTVGNMQEGGQYVLYWEAINGSCPVSRDSVVINNYAVPVAQFTQDSVEVCRDGCINFTNQSTIHSSDVITSYQWSATGDINNNENPQICWPYPGLFDVRLIVESSHGCRDTINKADLITVNTIPVADFNTYLVDDPNTSTKIQIQDQSQFSDSYWYSLGDGTTTTLQNPEHTYLDSGFYDITQIVSNNFGCRDTLRKTIFVHILVVYVPNTFTPDGNGINDTFYPSVSGDDPDAFLFRVFNRWGELIFQSQVKGLGWDGTHEGQPSKTDTYVWTLRTKYKDGDREKEYRGHVNLLR